MRFRISICAFCLPALGLAGTVIQDTIYTSFPPQAFEGRLTISGPAMTTAQGKMISRWTRDFSISGGQFQVELEPNDTATPSGTSYYVVYRPKSGMAWSEYWVVPTSATPLSIAQVRVPYPPSPQLVVQLGQLAPGGAQAGQCLQWDGGAWKPGACSSGGSPVAGVEFSKIHLKDDFTPGARAGIAVAGELPWDIQGSGFTLEAPSASSGAMGILALAPYVSPNSYAAAHLGGYALETKWFSAASSQFEVWWRVRTDYYETSELEYRLGLLDNFGLSPPNHGLFIRFRNNTGCTVTGSDPGWVYETRAAGSSTTASSGMSVTTNTWYTFRIRKVEPGKVRFSGCSGPPACTLSQEVELTTNIPTAELVPVVQVSTCVSGYRKLLVDRFEALIAQ
jgi:hypothetical protein